MVKHLRSVKFGIFFLLGFLVLGYAEVWGADWKLYGSNDEAIFFYDAESITHPSKNIVRVREKMVETEKRVIEKVKEFGEKYRTLDYAISLNEYDCKEKKRAILQVVSYSKTGSIYSNYSYTPEWDFIDPDTVVNILLKTLCKTTTTQKPQKPKKEIRPSEGYQKDVIQLLNMTGADKLIRQIATAIVGKTIDALANQNPKISQQVISVVKEETNRFIAEEMGGLLLDMVPIYAKYLSHEDVKGLLRFYKTPVGMKLIRVTPALTAELMTAGDLWGRKWEPELDRRIYSRITTIR